MGEVSIAENAFLSLGDRAVAVVVDTTEIGGGFISLCTVAGGVIIRPGLVSHAPAATAERVGHGQVFIQFHGLALGHAQEGGKLLGASCHLAFFNDGPVRRQC